MTHTVALLHKPELDGELDAYDFKDRVILVFDDGGFLHFSDAFAREEGAGYLVVYTEHCGYHVFWLESLADSPQYYGILPDRYKEEEEEEEESEEQ